MYVDNVHACMLCTLEYPRSDIVPAKPAKEEEMMVMNLMQSGNAESLWLETVSESTVDGHGRGS